MTIRGMLVIGLLVVAPALPAAAQSAASLQAALDLYAAASYDEALRALDELRAQPLDAPVRAAVEQHRMLCLVALGRNDAAEAAAAALLDAQPMHTLGAGDASPRVRALFDTTRRRVLPSVARRLYAEAKTAYDGGDFTRAGAAFGDLGRLLADPHGLGADHTLDDLRTLTDGFAQLSAAAVEHATARRDLETVRAAMGALRDPDPVRTAISGLPPVAVDADAPLAPPPAPAAAIAVPPPFRPIDIFTYDWRNGDVTPPTPIEQPLSGWWGPMGEPSRGTRLGVLDLVVDEQGRVADAAIYQSVNRVYDTVLLASVKQWRYAPAMRGGRPVKYRRVTGVVSQR